MKKLDKFLRLMHLAGFVQVDKSIAILEGKNVAVLGTSPISLVAAHIWDLVGAKVDIYEKKECIGGAWAKFEHGGKTYPISTHIIMPNSLSTDILHLSGAKSKLWDLAPVEFDIDTGKRLSFPSTLSSRYSGQKFDYASRSSGLAQDIFKALLKKNVNFINEAVVSVAESLDSLEIVTSDENHRHYDFSFVTPAIETRFKINEKNIQINYDTHINKSIIYEYPSEFFNGSAFFHLLGNTPVRELQIFNISNDKTLLVVKLSKQGSFQDGALIKQTIERVIGQSLQSAFLKKVENITYANTRMDLESQYNLNHDSKRITFPVQITTQEVEKFNEDKYRISQDISLVLNDLSFYENLFFTR